MKKKLEAIKAIKSVKQVDNMYLCTLYANDDDISTIIKRIYIDNNLSDYGLAPSVGEKNNEMVLF